ncbi:MAG: hypothetical protein QOJ49_1402 [Actinomycetota bacterium]|nr:hypothetical protein [Actinomycetota bacterium]
MFRESLTEWFSRWVVARPPAVDLLPGRPPPAPDAGPAADPRDPTHAARRVRAVCCSGGGIRAAAYVLGGLQRLGRPENGKPSWYSEADFVTAVSGGSYMASSFAMLNHDLTGDLPPYAAGSPEEHRLRAHTRYLVEDPRVAAVGIVSILYGLLLNLLPLLASLYVLAKLLGWSLHAWHVLTPTPSDPQTWKLGHVGAMIVVVVGLVVLGVVLFSIERLHDVYQSPKDGLTRFLDAWTIRVLALAAWAAALLLGVPLVLRAASTTSINPGGLPFGDQATGFVATSLAIVGLVKGTLGRFTTKLTTTTEPTKRGIAGLAGKGLRALAPWAGSAVGLGLLLVAMLAWSSSAAYNGFRWKEAWYAVGAALVVVVWKVVTDVNRNSIHSFYRARLASAFAVKRDETGTHAMQRPYSEPVPLEGLTGKPALVICAAVNTDEAGRVPSGRGCAPWTFSHAYTGITSGTMFGGEPGLIDDSTAGQPAPYGMVATAEYVQRAGRRLVTVPGAVAVSGAAVSPAMGRMTRAPIRILLGLANVRLGLWLPNPLLDTPRHPGTGVWQLMKWQSRQPGPIALLREMLGRTSLTRNWVYVTDGGHYENTGLVEALRRGATEVVVLDASGDTPGSWEAFGLAMQTARADLGVEIDLDPTKMRPKSDGAGAPTLVVQGTATYPNGVRADLWLCKLALPEVASWDVMAWAKGHPAFPNDSTSQQLYGDREFEAYRALGELAASEALKLFVTEKAEQARPKSTDVRRGSRVPAQTEVTSAQS